jgi:hypothetical protein
MVSEILVPSSSSSSSGYVVSHLTRVDNRAVNKSPRTDSDWLDAHTLLKVGVGSVVCIFGMQNSLSAQGIHECSST